MAYLKYDTCIGLVYRGIIILLVFYIQNQTKYLTLYVPMTKNGLVMKYLSAGRFKISYYTISWVCCRHAYDVSKYLLFKCWNLLQTKWKSKGFYDWKLGVFSNHIHLELWVNLVSNFRGYEKTFQSMKKKQVKISKFAPRTSFDLNDLKMTHCEFQKNYHGTHQFLSYMLRIAFGFFVHLFSCVKRSLCMSLGLPFV